MTEEQNGQRLPEEATRMSPQIGGRQERELSGQEPELSGRNLARFLIRHIKQAIDEEHLVQNWYRDSEAAAKRDTPEFAAGVDEFAGEILDFTARTPNQVSRAVGELGWLGVSTRSMELKQVLLDKLDTTLWGVDQWVDEWELQGDDQWRFLRNGLLGEIGSIGGFVKASLPGVLVMQQAVGELGGYAVEGKSDEGRVGACGEMVRMLNSHSVMNETAEQASTRYIMVMKSMIGVYRQRGLQVGDEAELPLFRVLLVGENQLKLSKEVALLAVKTWAEFYPGERSQIVETVRWAQMCGDGEVDEAALEQVVAGIEAFEVMGQEGNCLLRLVNDLDRQAYYGRVIGHPKVVEALKGAMERFMRGEATTNPQAWQRNRNYIQRWLLKYE